MRLRLEQFHSSVRWWASQEAHFGARGTGMARYPLTGYTRIQNVELLDPFVQLHTAGEQLGKCQNILKNG